MRDFDFALGKLAKRLPARSVRLARMILIQAVRNAMVNDLVVRNVADPARTKAEKSRRVFQIPQIPEIAVAALRELVLKQAAHRAKAGTAWKENNLVFGTSLGGPMYPTDIRMEFKRITDKAGLGRDWAPRELRHTVVSLLSGSGVPVEQIPDAVGHSSTPDNRGRLPAPAPAGDPYRGHRAGPAVESRGKTNGGQS